MKNYYYILVLTFGLFFLSCNRNKTDEKDIYSLLDDTVYKISDNIYEKYTFYDSKKHGVMHHYNLKYGMVEERLYLQNKLMLVKQFGDDSIVYGYTYLYNDGDTLYPIGSLAYDIQTDQKNQKMCTYFEVSAPDTISYGEQYRVKITGNYGLHEGFKVSLVLGEIDSNFILRDKTNEYHSDNNKLEFSTRNYELGINLITGHLKYFEYDKDVTTNYRITDKKFPLIFYKQFVVIPPAEHSIKR